jgi:signal peptidase I
MLDTAKPDGLHPAAFLEPHLNQVVPRTKSSSGGAVETLKTIVYAVLIAVAVRTVAFEPFNIPSGSMVPTLLVGDYLFVSKYSYGYSRHSLPFSLPLIPGRIFFNEPERGDVAVFKTPEDNSTDYIKRIVGLPGDRIAVRNGILQVNGEPVKRTPIKDFPMRPGDVRPHNSALNVNAPAYPVRQYDETLPSGRTHLIIEEHGDAWGLDNWPPAHAGEAYVVPPGHYFLMGDNRDNSQDSRVIGPVPAVNLVGRAEFIFFSVDGSAQLWEFWKWPFAIRYERLFQPIR